MDDLVEFLRARLDEDAEAARLAEAVDPSPWYEDVEEGTYTNQRDHLDGVGLVRAADNAGLWDREQSCTLSMTGVTATHVARHDPARVLAEVEAKRKLLRLATQARKNADLPPETPFGPSSAGFFVSGFAAAMEHTLRLFAQAYREHPDYRPDWAPSA